VVGVKEKIAYVELSSLESFGGKYQMSFYVSKVSHSSK